MGTFLLQRTRMMLGTEILIFPSIFFFLIIAPFEYLTMNELMPSPKMLKCTKRYAGSGTGTHPGRVMPGYGTMRISSIFRERALIELLSSCWVSQCSLWCSTDSYEQSLFNIFIIRLYHYFLSQPPCHLSPFDADKNSNTYEQWCTPSMGIWKLSKASILRSH